MPFAALGKGESCDSVEDELLTEGQSCGIFRIAGDGGSLG